MMLNILIAVLMLGNLSFKERESATQYLGLCGPLACAHLEWASKSYSSYIGMCSPVAAAYTELVNKSSDPEIIRRTGFLIDRLGTWYWIPQYEYVPLPSGSYPEDESGSP